MGGTSTDVGLIENAVPQVSGELELEYAMPIHVPMVDVHTIGAGGGSIASVDAAGMLRVGPESAGARPGPICYGRGGTEPTITDANLILGRLNPDRLLGVDHPVTLDHVRGDHRGEGRQAARPRRRCRGGRDPAHRQRPHGGRDPAGVAVARPRSARLRAVRLRRRRAAARHGAGARARRSRRCWCRRGPASPTRWAASSPTCATTMCARSTSRCRRSTMPTVARIYAEQTARGRGDDRDARACRCASCARVYTADMQFQGQSHILSVGVDRAGHRRRGPAQGLRRRLLAPLRHRAGGDPAGAGQPAYRRDRRAAGDFAGRAGGDRARADLGGRAGRRAPRVVQPTAGTRRRSMRATGCRLDAAFEGPAILEQLDCTTVVEPGDRVTQDKLGNLLIAVG